MTALGGGQQALVAVPEKALLDLIYLQAGGDDPAYLETLRLQNLDLLRPDELNRLAERFASSKVSRAVATVRALMQTEKEYETL